MKTQINVGSAALAPLREELGVTVVNRETSLLIVEEAKKRFKDEHNLTTVRSRKMSGGWYSISGN